MNPKFRHIFATHVMDLQEILKSQLLGLGLSQSGFPHVTLKFLADFFDNKTRF